MLESEYQFYKDNIDKFTEQYLGKFIVIVGKEIIGVYDNQISAYSTTIKTHALGTFLIQEIKKDPNQTIARFTSLVYVN